MRTGKRLHPPAVKRSSGNFLKTPNLPSSDCAVPQGWANGQIDELIRKLDQITPYFYTPLVQAMLEAANKDLKTANGMKTLLVLTDGNDTQIEKNAGINPTKLSIAEFVKERFRSLGIRINMVFFTPAGNQVEIDKAEQLCASAMGLDPADHSSRPTTLSN